MRIFRFGLLLVAVGACTGLHAQQKPATLDQFTREKLHMLLRTEYREIQQHYYDPRYRGVDLAALYKTLDARARVIQLEHRGKVLGDRTAGAVMESKGYRELIGADTVIPAEFSITFANLIMSDGKSRRV